MVLTSVWPCQAKELSHTLAHVGVGLTCGLIAAKVERPAAGVSVAFTLGVAKEFCDERGHEPYRSRRRDVLLTTIPAAITVRWRF